MGILKVSIKRIVKKGEEHCLKEIRPEDVKVPVKSVMGIDGSTTNTGIAIISEDGALYYMMAIERDSDEWPVRYKVHMKRLIRDILIANPNIKTVFYEEPFIGYANAAANLMMLRTFVEELIVENEPQLDYINHAEINNLRWKKLFLAPDKVPQGTDLQKEAVRNKLLRFLPFLSTLSQDEIDAIAMTYAICVQMARGMGDELQSKKKVRPFKYEVVFIGAEDDEAVCQELLDIYTGPEKLLENGITLVQANGREDFDRKVYDTMGDDDKVVIVKFSSNKYGNKILEHRIGHIADSYNWVYAITWRKNRKR